jgi:hypothetical protein
MIDRLHGKVIAEQTAPHRTTTIDNQDPPLALGVDQFSNKGVILKTLDGLGGTGKFLLAAIVTKNGSSNAQLF